MQRIQEEAGMKRFALILFALLILASCSTTRVLGEGEYSLAENKIVVVNDKKFNSSELSSYLKQHPNSFSPANYIYNWKNGKNESWDRFCEKLGREPVVYDSMLVKPSLSGIGNHLEYLGYYNSNIESFTRYKKKKAYVTYYVNLGKQYPLSKINYTVKDSTLTAIMASDSANFTIFPGDPLSENSLEKESERLSQVFRNNGYWNFTKNHFFYFADTTTNPSQADLHVVIEDYTRNESKDAARPHIKYKVGNVSIRPQGNLKIRQKFLENLNHIDTGVVYNESEIQRTYNRFSSVPLFNTVNMQLTEIDSASLNCDIQITASKIQSLKATLEGSISASGLWGVSPAITYTHKNLFKGAEVLNVGFKGNFQFVPSTKVNCTEFTVNTSLRLPQFLFLPQRLFDRLPQTEFSLDFTYLDRPEFKRRTFAAKYGYTWSSIDNRLSYQLYPIHTSIALLHDVDPEFLKQLDPASWRMLETYVNLGAKFNFYYTTSTQINPKNTYFYFRSNITTSGNLLSGLYSLVYPEIPQYNRTVFGVPFSQFVRAETHTVQTWRFGRDNKMGLALRLVAGAAYPYGNSSIIPLEYVFYVGGASSMRGWQSRTLGPGNTAYNPETYFLFQTGDMRLETNLEFRFPLVWKLNSVLFADFGNIWNLPKDKKYNEENDGTIFSFKNFFRTSGFDWGTGLRLDLGMLLVRVDIGFKTYDPSFEKWIGPRSWFTKRDAFALHFGIGYPF